VSSIWKSLRTGEQVQVFFALLRWLLIATIAGVFAGTASALLLVSLNWATEVRESHRWLILLLPLAGLIVGRGWEQSHS
jgi:H+/Cl- antiporter ClcA